MASQDDLRKTKEQAMPEHREDCSRHPSSPKTKSEYAKVLGKLLDLAFFDRIRLVKVNLPEVD